MSQMKGSDKIPEKQQNKMDTANFQKKNSEYW